MQTNDIQLMWLSSVLAFIKNLELIYDKQPEIVVNDSYRAMFYMVLLILYKMVLSFESV